MLTDNEVLEAVRSSDDMRLRSMKSDESLRVSDMTVVERFLCNTTFGYSRWNEEEQTAHNRSTMMKSRQDGSRSSHSCQVRE